MATIRLIASTVAVSNANYASVANENNMFTNCDSTTYGTFTHNRASTNNTYYGYIRGFNFGSVPTDATVSSFTVKIKASATGHTTSTSSSYYMSLINNTTQIGSTTASGRLSTTVTTFTFANGSLTWNTIVGYGENFGIRVPLRRASSNTADVVSVYGAEIEVTYTVPNPRTITSTLSGNGTISPSGAQTYYDGDEYELTITPTNISDTVTVTNNNVDVTDQLEEHYSGGTSTSYSTASGSGVTTGFARSGGAFYQSSSTSSDSWLRYAIGRTAESPYSTSNTSNTYCKDGTNDSTTQGWMNYPFDFSSLPNDAEVTAVEVKCYGAAESTSETARHADVSLWCGNEQKGTTQQFTSTSNTTMTISDPGEWTREDLQNAWVRFGVGYYGGRILGITWTVTYTYGGTLHHYTYSYNVDGNATIAVTIGGGGSSPKIFVKEEGLATLLYTDTNTNSDENIQAYNSYNDGTLSVNDNIKVVLSNIVAYRSGMARISNFNDTIITTLTSNQNEYVGENEIKVRVYYSSNYYQISPYYLYNGYNCIFTGTMSIYKLDSSGGWVQYSKVYKKVNGSWVEQASSTWATLFNTNTNYRKME